MTNAEFEAKLHAYVDMYASEIMSGNCNDRNARVYARSASAIVSLFDGPSILARCPRVNPSGAEIVRTAIIPTLDQFRTESVENRINTIRKTLLSELIPSCIIAHATGCDAVRLIKFLVGDRELEVSEFFGVILFMEMFHQAVEGEVYRRKSVAKPDTSICTAEPCKGDDV